MSATTPTKNDSAFPGVWGSVRKFLGGVASTNGEKHGAGDLSPRAAKRRRVAEGPPDSAAVAAVGPLFSDPSQGHTRALRVQVLRIGRDSLPDPDANGLFRGNGSPVKKDVPFKEIRARCKLTIFKFKPRVERRSMYCDSQFCDVKIFRDADDVCRQARIYLPQPFQIPAEKLYVERDDSQGFMLADNYLVQTELESAGNSKWPPFDLLPTLEQEKQSSPPPRQWVLSSVFSYTFAKGRLTTPVMLRKAAGKETETDLAMETDLRWSTLVNMQEKSGADHGFHSTDAPQSNGVLAPLTNGIANGRAEKITAFHREEDDDAGDEEEGDEDAVTPSRSLRMRDKPQNYNLKLLSDKARGKELKERKKRKDAKAREAGHVTWILPIHHVETEKWTCIRCSKEHDSINSLKLHIEEHEEFSFTAEYTNRGGWRIVTSERTFETPLASRTDDFLAPPSPDDHDHDFKLEESPSKAATQSQQKVVPVKRAAPGSLKPARQKIPDNKQPMYDRLSKVVLEPLSVVDEPPVNNSWLLQKHRDIISDYTDVSPNEKEYITRWDAHVLTHRATLSPHFNDIFLDFIEENASWLVASQHRMDEAGKHLGYLNARDALDRGTVDQTLQILKMARSQHRQAPSDEDITSTIAGTRFSKSGCRVCGQPTPGPRELICSNWGCDQKWYHVDCVEGDMKPPIDRTNWQCQKCRTKSLT